MPAEILLQCIQRRTILGKSRSFEPSSRARTGRIRSVPFSSAAAADTRPWSGFPGWVKRIQCFDARPPCVLRPAGVLAPHWSARNPPPPRPLPASFTSSGEILGAWIKRQTLLFFCPFCEQGRKKMSVHKIERCNVEISLAILEPQHSDTLCLLLLLPRTGQTLPFPPFTEISYFILIYSEVSTNRRGNNTEPICRENKIMARLVTQ